LTKGANQIVGVEVEQLLLHAVKSSTRPRHCVTSVNNIVDQSIPTFYNHISAQKINDQEKTRTLQALGSFFDYYHDIILKSFEGPLEAAPHFANPIKQDDKWNSVKRRKTHRCSLGSELLEYISKTLLDPDEHGQPTFNWVKNHALQSKRDWITVVDPETKETVREWWPGRAIALYTLLQIPIRGIQVRWLDEGLGDEYIYDHEKQTLVLNTHPLAEPGRNEGVFRLIEDLFHGNSFVGLYINTNKTKLYDPKISRGYEIPWPFEELFKLLRMMSEWNSKFFPNPRPVSFADDPAYTVTEAVKPYLPKFYPLFRDPTSIGSRNTNLPLSSTKIGELWDQLLGEVERRLKAEGKSVKLVNWVKDPSYSTKTLVPKARFDIHTLRISGITSLLERGVPVHIVSEYIAGHTTLVMTLYYEKIHPAKVREMLLQAQNKVEADLDGCLALLDEIEDPEGTLVWNNFDYPGNDAPEALKANRGLWKVALDGICPGTLCEEGGPLNIHNQPTAVPTGACGLCRYFLTGPAFLYGQMHKINNLMYRMREKGEELTQLRLKVIDLKNDKNKRLLYQEKGRVEHIERELTDIMREWINRYRMFQASLAMLDRYEKQEAKAQSNENTAANRLLIPLLSASDENDFRPIVLEAKNLGLVRQISLLHEILGGFDLHKGPLKEYESILDTILSKNNFETLLLTIPPEKRTSAANMLGEFLMASFGEEGVINLYKGESPMLGEAKLQAEALLSFIKSDSFTLEAAQVPLVQ
jgi:Putative phage integrase